MFDSNLSTLITYNPPSVSADTPLVDLLNLADELNVHHWPVVDGERRLVGYVAEIDIVRAVTERLTAFAAVSEYAVESSHWQPCLVAEMMSRQVVTVGLNDSTKKALRLLIDHHVDSLPVTEDGRLIAILTSTDFLRELSYGQFPLSREGVSRFATPPPETIDVDATLDEAEQAFQEAQSNYLCVLQGELPLGVISRRDVRGAKCREVTSQILVSRSTCVGPTTVAQLVRQSQTVMPGHSLCEAAARMLEAGKQAITVVNRANRLHGVITEDNILRTILYEGF